MVRHDNTLLKLFHLYVEALKCYFKSKKENENNKQNIQEFVNENKWVTNFEQHGKLLCFFFFLMNQ